MPLKYSFVDVPKDDGSTIKAIEVDDSGHPIVIDTDKGEEDEGRLFGLDAIHLYRRIPDLNNRLKQAQDNYERYKAVFNKIREKYTDIDLNDEDSVNSWLDDVAKASETVKGLKDGQLKTAQEIENIRKSATEEMQKKLDRQKQELEERQKALADELEKERGVNHQLMISDRFNSSKFIKDKLVITPRIAEKYWGDRFKIKTDDNGKRIVVGYWPDGQEILSAAKGFEYAEFEEALEKLAEKDPDRDTIFGASAGSGTGASGSGVRGGNGSQPNPFKKETKNLTEAMKIQRENPELAQRLMKEAGINPVTAA